MGAVTPTCALLSVVGHGCMENATYSPRVSGSSVLTDSAGCCPNSTQTCPSVGGPTARHREAVMVARGAGGRRVGREYTYTCPSHNPSALPTACLFSVVP